MSTDQLTIINFLVKAMSLHMHRILIVDDDPQLTDAISLYLSDFGFQTVIAWTENEARHALAQELSPAILNLSRPLAVSDAFLPHASRPSDV